MLNEELDPYDDGREKDPWYLTPEEDAEMLAAIRRYEKKFNMKYPYIRYGDRGYRWVIDDAERRIRENDPDTAPLTKLELYGDYFTLEDIEKLGL